jgi:hypothetical protein
VGETVVAWTNPATGVNFTATNNGYVTVLQVVLQPGDWDAGGFIVAGPMTQGAAYSFALDVFFGIGTFANLQNFIGYVVPASNIAGSGIPDSSGTGDYSGMVGMAVATRPWTITVPTSISLFIRTVAPPGATTFTTGPGFYTGQIACRRVR